jgi:transcriptional regulator with XRE-family HTH domain
MTPVRGPAVPRRRLGAELRRLREEAKMRIEQVAEALECSTSKISRLETGKGIPKARDVKDLLTLYGVTDTKVRDQLIRWACDGQQQGWWHDFSEVLDEKEETFVALEADAASMRSYETMLVHGLLQTVDYMREIAKVLLEGAPKAEIDLFVELRKHRQEVLSRTEGALELHVIMEEPALYRPVGGPEVMREQLGHLLRMAERPNVTLQVLPLSIGIHPALTGSFQLLAFPDGIDHGVVYAEGVGGAVVLEHAKDVATYTRAFDVLRRRALNTDDSVNFIAGVLPGKPTDQGKTN